MLKICQLILILLTLLWVSFDRLGRVVFPLLSNVWVSVRRCCCNRFQKFQETVLGSQLESPLKTLPRSLAIQRPLLVAVWDSLRPDRKQVRAWCPILVQPPLRYRQPRQ
jgi:hypothetical protein